MCSITSKLCCFSVIVGETSVLPNVYRNSFAARTTMNHYTLRYSEKNEWVIGKRSCKSCSSGETTAWNNVTSVLNYDNVTVSNPVMTIIRRPTIKRRLSLFILDKTEKAVLNVVTPLSLVTNSLSVAIFVRMHRRIQSELLFVFVSLSVVDTFALSLTFNKFVWRVYKKMALTRYNVGCQVVNWLGGSGQVCSSYLVLLTRLNVSYLSDILWSVPLYVPHVEYASPFYVFLCSFLLLKYTICFCFLLWVVHVLFDRITSYYTALWSCTFSLCSGYFCHTVALQFSTPWLYITWSSIKDNEQLFRQARRAQRTELKDPWLLCSSLHQHIRWSWWPQWLFREP